MANQFGRPVEDLVTDDVFGATTAEIAVSQGLPVGASRWSRLDETSPSDGDYIESNDTARWATMRFGPLYDPGVDTGHTVHVRARKLTSGNSILVYLFKDNGDGTYTTVYTSADTPISTSWATYDFAIPSGDIGALATEHYLRGLVVGVEITVLSLGNVGQVSWVELETPPAEAVAPILTDEITMSLESDPAKTVGAIMLDELEFSMTAPGLNDPSRLIDGGRLFVVTRSRLSLRERSALIDFEDA